MSPALRHLMPESRTAMTTSSRPLVTPQARSTAAPIWPHWLWSDERSAGSSSRSDPSFQPASVRGYSDGTAPGAGSSAGP
jgi:hypothetical protein